MCLYVGRKWRMNERRQKRNRSHYVLSWFQIRAPPPKKKKKLQVIVSALCHPDCCNPYGLRTLNSTLAPLPWVPWMQAIEDRQWIQNRSDSVAYLRRLASTGHVIEVRNQDKKSWLLVLLLSSFIHPSLPSHIQTHSGLGLRCQNCTYR